MQLPREQDSHPGCNDQSCPSAYLGLAGSAYLAGLARVGIASLTRVLAGISSRY